VRSRAPEQAPPERVANIAPRGLDASFRDPAGVVFRRDGVVLRQVNECYRADYDRLVGSGLYDALVARGLLIPHEEVEAAPLDHAAYRILRPEPVPFISYPFEWCFSQLKHAALATLDIQETALASGMSLKDASAYNIQFRGCQPVLIDTLSFERYRDRQPWVAYRQFCRHFLAPLALMSAVDVRLGQLAQVHLDGVPLDLASRLLPARTRLRFSLASHTPARRRGAGAGVGGCFRNARPSQPHRIPRADRQPACVGRAALVAATGRRMDDIRPDDQLLSGCADRERTARPRHAPHGSRRHSLGFLRQYGPLHTDRR